MSSSSPPPSTPTMQTVHTTSPPLSPSPSPSSPTSLSGRRTQTPLSLDLNNIPPLSTPAPPSNTLLITRLSNPAIFHPASLATIREHLSTLAQSPLNSFSPLKSLSRIIVSFHDTDSALRVRQAIDGTAFLGDSIAKCYFGEPTPIGDATKYLERPDAGRLFFISPPPSPPIGWEIRNEGPPNKEVHANDLAQKLARLTGKMTSDPNAEDDEEPTQYQYTREELALKLKTNPQHPSYSKLSTGDDNSPTKIGSGSRSRSSTLIYDPKAHGDSPGLPAVMLETEDDSEVELAVPERTIIAHTSRPPVELME